MINTSTIRLVSSFLIILAALTLAMTASAHGDGASIEKSVNGYLIDIGYSPSKVVSGEQTRLDFLLFKVQGDGASKEESSEPIDFSSVFVRLEKDDQLQFAGELKKPEFGQTGLTYAFPSTGDYTGYVRYHDNDDTLVETEFDLKVEKGEGNTTSNLPVLALFVGVIVGVVLFLIFRNHGSYWRGFYRRLSSPFTSQAPLPFDSTKNFSTPTDTKKAFLDNLLVQLAIGLVFAAGAYFGTSWYLGNEVKWPNLATLVEPANEEADQPLSGQEIGKVSVVLTERGFEPSDLTIKRGTTVVFSTTAGRPFWPASNLHPTHEIYSAFDPQKPIAANETWSFTFDQVGDWNMHDHIRSYFTGTIHVVP